jgi:hypothetical protein
MKECFARCKKRFPLQKRKVRKYKDMKENTKIIKEIGQIISKS